MTDKPLAAGPSGLSSADGQAALSRKLLDEFRQEALENLDEAEQCLLGLDRGQKDSEVVAELFRRVHTIKGGASYVGLGAIAELAHALEGVLAVARQQEAFALPGSLIDVCFETVDGLRAMIANPADQGIAVGLVRRLAEERDVLGGGTAATPATAAQAHRHLSDPLAIFIDAATQHVETMELCLGRAREGAARDDGTVDMFFRAAHSLKGGARYMGFTAVEAAVDGIEGLLEPLRLGEAGYSPRLLDALADFVGAVTVELARIVGERRPPKDTAAAPDGPATDAAVVPEGPCPARPAPAAGVAVGQDLRTMRVNQGLLDVFMNLVGELVVARNVLGHVEKSLERQAREPLPGLRDLRGASQMIWRIAEEMQRQVMAMRLAPVRAVFQKFPRIIRDICQQNGKQIDLVLQGEDTEIDKGIAEIIGDPLVHIVRNAADHGIESPEERRRLGKPERGTVILRAAQEGNFVVIEAIDDGAGIDPEVILAKAVAKGMVPPGETTLSRGEILNLIFRPGLSTAEEVTAISGRGVGMDVVLTNLRKVNGGVTVDSQVGAGTRIRLELPLTLAVIEALLVGVGESTYAIPVEAIRETVKAPRRSIKRLLRKKALTLRGEVVGLESLAALLGLPASPDDAASEDEVAVLVLERDGQALGLAVDKLLRQEEIVIKPLVDYLANLPGLAGASILGDGRALLVLDPSELLDMALGGRKDGAWAR